jgi:hypothetical protein
MYVLRRHVTETAGVICTAYGTERLNSATDVNFNCSELKGLQLKEAPSLVYC